MARLLDIVSWNVRGLGDATKRCAVFTFLRRFQPAILFVSETHMVKDSLHLMNRPWLGHYFHSTYSSHSRGVSVLVHRQIPFICTSSLIDADGRYVCLACSVYRVHFILIALYIPPPYSGEVLKKVLTFIASLPVAPILVMGDFNNYIHPYWDKFHTGNISPGDRPTSMARVLEEVGLRDVWRLRFPTSRVYSCYSASHHSLSRIDLALGSELLLPMVKLVEYLPRSVSDHSPLRVRLTVGMSGGVPRQTWRLNPFWAHLLDVVLLREIEEFFQTNESSASSGVVWDTMKAVVRGLYIREISKRKSKSRELTETLQQRVTDTEAQFILDPSEGARADWVEAQSLLKDHMLTMADNKRFFTKQKFFMEGESAGHLLATVVRSQQGSSHIVKLSKGNGEWATEDVDILGVLRNFYYDLYTSRAAGQSGDVGDFLTGMALPRLSLESRQLLDEPLRLEELERALQQLPNEKAPGADGLPGEFYKVYSETLLPRLLTVFNDALSQGYLPGSMAEAIIVLILKPDKDPTLPGSYRPISLLTSDVKLLAKVLANRLSTVITEVIHVDQSGFMPNRSTAVNIRRLFLNLQMGGAGHSGKAILSLDAAKAFDSIEWSFLWAVLRRMGFGPIFISWVQLLYQGPTARIRANGLTSTPFALQRGTRQGCPLSPLLFAIAIEPLACSIRESPRLTGFRVGHIEERISLYADDMLLYLGDVVQSLPPAMEIIELFGRWSGLLINWDKSVLLPVDPLPPSFSPASTPLQIVQRFKYLGIMISARPSDFLELNLAPLLLRFSSKLDAWCRLPMSVIGRGNLVKMIFMPQLLYVLHNAPTWIPMYQFHKVNRLFRALIWKKKYARIRLETLQRDKTDGGLAIPNPWLYFLAAQLQHFAGWADATGMGATGRLITQWSGRVLPCYVLESGGTSDTRRNCPTMALMYKVWDRGKEILGLKGCLRYTPLWKNPNLAELSKLHDFEGWCSKGVQTIEHILKDGTLKSFEQMQSDFGIPRTWFFQYLQLRHAWAAQVQGGSLSPQRDPTVDSLLGSVSTKGVISMIYRALLSGFMADYTIPAKAKWERDVGQISEDQWTGVLNSTPSLSPSEAQRLSQLFLLHRAYKSPALLYKIGLRADSACPRCGQGDAHLMHMMWDCSALQGFWREVVNTINTVHGLQLMPDPKLCILGITDTPDPDSPIAISLARMLFQARKLVAQHWIRPSPPALREYINRMNNVIRLEKAVYSKRKVLHKYEALWGPWLDTPGLPSAILLLDRVGLPG